MKVEELAALAKRHQRGEVSEEELANTVRTISASISFDSAMTTFESLYGPPRPTWHTARIAIPAIDASQPCLQYDKLHLVKWLFARAEDFDRLNTMYFPNHPLSVLRLGNGRFAVIDGHHRLWQAGVLFGPEGEVTVRMVNTRNDALLTNFRSEVRKVEEINGSAQLRMLPIRERPDSSAVLRLVASTGNGDDAVKRLNAWLPPDLKRALLMWSDSDPANEHEQD
jgi:hypothetical protein